MQDCPYIETCPYSKMETETEDSWKMKFCYGDSINGYKSCARYEYRTSNDTAPPKDLMPNGFTLKV